MSTLPSAAEKWQALAAELWSYDDVAAVLKVSAKSVYRNPPPGRVTLGRNVRFVAAEVRRWIAAGCPARAR